MRIHSPSHLVYVIAATVCFLTLAGIAFGCEGSDSNATYNKMDVHHVIKMCKTGYSMGPVEEQILTCKDPVGNGTEWQEEEKPCEECTFPNYGENCSKEVTGNCSTVCPYNTTLGCARSEEAESWEVCDLNSLKLHIIENRLSGTVGLPTEKILKIIAQVNINEADVTVQAIFNDNITVLNTTGNGTYELTVQVNLKSDGQYLIRANTSFSFDEENVTVVIYDPAKIVGVYKDSEEEEMVTKGSTVHAQEGANERWTCEATGVQPPEVWWYFGGVNISEIQLENRLYQVRGNSTSTLYIHSGMDLRSEDSGTYTCVASNSGDGSTYIDVFAMNLLIGGNQPPVEYAERKDLLISVTVLGVVLLLTIVTFAGIATWLRKNSGDFKKKESPAPRKRGNNYTPAPVSADEFTDVSPPDQPESTPIKMYQRAPASLPKPKQEPRNTKLLDPSPKPAYSQSPLAIPIPHGMHNHRPGNGLGAQKPSALYPPQNHSHHNQAFQHEKPRHPDPQDTYDEPETSHPELTRQHQYGQRAESQPFYEQPSPDTDEHIYEATLSSFHS